MDGTADGSPRAARGAQRPEPGPGASPERRPGLFHRLFGGSEPDDGPNSHSNGAGSEEFPAENPFTTRNPPVRDFAVPRAEIVAVPIDIGLEQLVSVFRNSGRTRLPVYKDTLDHPRGFVHLKDLALEHGFNGASEGFNLSNGTLHDILYVAESMPAEDLLAMMRARRIHMALVIDEYGGTDGLVTFEDLVEVIFGEIADEHDDDEDWQIREEENGVWRCQARCPLDELAGKLGRELLDAEVDEEIDTLGGLVFLLAGRVPIAGEVIRHEAAGMEFEIVSADSRRIKEIRIRGSAAEAD